MQDHDVAIIAGGGSLPELLADAIIRTGKKVFVVALSNDISFFEANGISFIRPKIGQVGYMLREIRKSGAKTVCLAGCLRKPAMSEVRVDMGGIMLLLRILCMKNRGDDTILRVIIGYIEKHGINVVGADKFLPHLLLEYGHIACNTTYVNRRDIDLGIRILNTIANLDIGQSIVVQEGIVLGLEASEGTDELIKRCSGYARAGKSKPILVKLAKLVVNLIKLFIWSYNLQLHDHILGSYMVI